MNVAFTHPVDPERFEKKISLQLFERITDTMEEEQGKARFTVVYDKLRLNAYIHSEQLPVPDKAGRLAIRIEPGVTAVRGGNENQERLETQCRSARPLQPRSCSRWRCRSPRTSGRSRARRWSSR